MQTLSKDIDGTDRWSIRHEDGLLVYATITLLVILERYGFSPIRL